MANKISKKVGSQQNLAIIVDCQNAVYNVQMSHFVDLF